ncbi:MAG: DNA polymerase III subunit alpha [Bacillota bacterium]|jgi:DNA polymerase-3 subunit alpha
MGFVHLHNHTEYSLLDGAARVNKMIAKAKELGMPAIAITDHGVMYGIINFYQEAKKAGIRPIIGCEVYVAQRTRHDKEARRDDSPYHLVLLAENQEGYQNLCRLVSHAFLEGFYYKPRIDMELLQKYHQGIIALSACIAGELPDLILQDRIEDAKQLARQYRAVFGKDNYYIELQNHGMEEELKVNPILVQIARELDIGLVATNDIHYVDQSDANIHDILLCVQTGKIRDEENRMRFPCDQFYLKTEEEMRELFFQWPDAIDNTLMIAERCQVDFKFGDLYLPKYDVPDGFTLHSYLEHLCRQGLKDRYDEITPELQERLEYELNIINKMGFSGYFLIVWDLVHFSRNHNIFVGPGRGSAAGSLVAYILGITNIDPIKYKLLFERFLNPERISPPDIDIDFCYERRGEVIEYLVEKYGQEKVGQIITFGTMGARGAVKDVGRVLNIPYGEVDRLAKQIPHDPKIKLHDAIKNSPDLHKSYENDPQAKELLDIAMQIEGMPRHSSTHAAGVVIAREELISYMPVQKTADGFATTQYEKEQVEACGLLKMDILGLRTLTVIGDAVENIQRSHPELAKIDIDQIPLDDVKTYEMLSRGDTVCVFQLESSGMRNILRNLRPERFEDIIALVALYRPGPLGSGMVDQFIASKHGEKAITYQHPLLENILKETYGVILYQEQVMQIATALAGFTLGQADMLRRAMGKKKPEVIAKERDNFLIGCRKNGIDTKIAAAIFDLMEYFAGYGFNKSHSAAYAKVAYETAWLKANYPAEFMASMLTSVMDTADKVPEYIEECRRMEIAVLPPDINESNVKFTVNEGKIRFALSAVKNVGRDAVKRIVEEREANGPFTSLTDLCYRTSLNRKMLESLIKCGALDSFGFYRSQLLQIADKALEIGRKLSLDKEDQQLSLFDFGMDETEYVVPDLEFPDIDEYPSAELLAMEQETIGFYVSGHPLDAYKMLIQNKISHQICSLADLAHGEKVRVGGMINSVRHLLTKKGEGMAILNLEDQRESVKCIAFPRAYAACRDRLFASRIVILEGKLKTDDAKAEIIVEKIESPGKLFLRLSDSKDKLLIAQIKEFLLKMPGDLEISVYYDDLKQYCSLPGVSGVAMDEKMIIALKGLLGEDSVILR